MQYGRIGVGGKVLSVVRLSQGGRALDVLDAPPWEGGKPTGDQVPFDRARLLPPCAPTKIVCVARNYRDHAAELSNPVPEEPLLFLKPPSALFAPGEPIRLPPESARVDPEAEVALIVGRRMSRVDRRDVPAGIFGFTAFNDVTARDLQQRDKGFGRAKSFDTFAPLGPWIVPGLPPPDTTVVCRVNGIERQRGTVAQQVFGFEALVAFISNVMTLEPGDVVATGTPAGVAPVVAGDRIEIEVGGVEVLANPVVRAGGAAA